MPRPFSPLRVSDFLGLVDDVPVEIGEGNASIWQNGYKVRKKFVRRKGTTPLGSVNLTPDQDLNGLWWTKLASGTTLAQELLVGVHSSNVVDFYATPPGTTIGGGTGRFPNGSDCNAAWVNQQLFIGDGYAQNAYVGLGGALAAHFVNASNQALTIPSNASLQMAGTDWAIAGWVRFATVSGYRKVVVKQTSDATFEYGVQLNPTGAAGNPGLMSFTTGGGCQSATVLTANTWYWFYADFDLATTTLSLSINGAAPATQVVAAPSAGAGTFGIGYYGGTTLASAMDGDVDAVGIWKRKLTLPEQAFVYNGGSRIAMSSLTGAYLTNLASIYDFENSGNIGADGFGANNLTNVNTVTTTAAPGSGASAFVQQAMVAPPAAACVAAAGGVGSGTGDFHFVYAFLAANGQLSEVSPVSNQVTLAAQRADLTNVGISSEPGVSARYIFATGGTRTDYVLVTILANNTATTVTVNLDGIINPFSPLQTGNTRFPPCRYLVAHQSRLVGAWCATAEGDKSTVFISSYLAPWYSPLSPDLTIAANGTRAQLQGPAAGEITGLCPHGDVCSIFTGSAGFWLIGTQAADFRIQQFSTHGCVAHRTIQSVRHLLIWLAPDGIYSFDGRAVERISDDVRTTLEAMTATDKAKAHSFVFYDRYYISWPGHCLYLDLLTRQWGELTAWDWRASTVSTQTDTTQQRIYAAQTGHARTWQLEVGATDNGVGIPTVWQSRDFEMGMAAHQKRVHLIEVKWAKSTGTATVKLYRGTGDLIQTVTQDLSIVDFSGSEVVRLLASAVEQARDENFRLRIEYSGTAADYSILAAGLQWTLSQ